MIIAITAAVTWAVGIIISATYHDVPAYKNWGADDLNNQDGCTCCLSRPADISKTSAINEPVSALSSFLLFAATVDNSAAIFGGLLAAASFLLHFHGEDEARQLDFYTAAAAPTVLVFIAVPALSGFLLGAILIVLYEVIIPVNAVVIAGLVIAGLGAYYYKIDRYSAGAVVIAAASALLLEGGDKHSATCANDTALALAFDLRHFAWHLSAAILLWLGVGVFGGIERERPLQVAGATLIPVISRLTDLQSVYLSSWLITTGAAVLALFVVSVKE